MIKAWLAAAAACTATFGGTITYNYQGTTFDRCGHGGCPANYTSDFDSASLTFSNPLAANLSSADVTANLLSWTIGDALGYSAFSSSTAGAAQVLLSTNSGGAIVGYQVEAGVQMGWDVAMFNPQVIGGGSGLLFADAIDAILNPSTGAGFSASSHLTGQWTQALNGFQGGTSSAPVFLIGGVPITAVSGTIGGNGSQEYYSFLWGGGALNIGASVMGAPGTASYLLTGGGSNSCSNLGSQSLNSINNFSNTLSLPSLAPGQYCIGLNASDMADPNFALTFSTPVSGAPEPTTFVLLSFGMATICVLRRTHHRRQRR
jgi:hypothetical protein